MFFNSWTDLGRVLGVGVLAYGGLVLLLRVSGKRTLSKMNAFDLIVTVALGSTLATVLLSKEVALAEGMLAFALLISLQFAITWLSVRSTRISGLVKAQPALLLHRGEFLRSAMKWERVTEEEIRAALRAQGITMVSDAEAVVLETDGTFTILTQAARGPGSSLEGVTGAPLSHRAGETTPH